MHVEVYVRVLIHVCEFARVYYARVYVFVFARVYE